MHVEFAKTGAQNNASLIAGPGIGEGPLDDENNPTDLPKEIVVLEGSFSVSADAVVTLSKGDAAADTNIFKRSVLGKTNVEIRGPFPLGANVPLKLTTSTGDINGTIRYIVRRVLSA